MLRADRTRTEPGIIIIDLLVVAILCSILRKLLPLHTFLEFGASDRAVINLMCLGLSRTSAILLKNTVSLHSDMTLQQGKRHLDAVNLARIAIPAVYKAEISPFAR